MPGFVKIGSFIDTKIEHYRTPEVNRVIAQIAELSKVFGGIKKAGLLKILREVRSSTRNRSCA